ncbi:MAG TPA: heat-inducible transcriptional repressor HrcA [Bacillota bacterium]|nr:heat-inducible transcriptional repressor HrcA [Bacillota bacterium]
MDDRKKWLLKTIIEDYIETAEPVGSKYLTTKHKLDISPATVRNYMAELEEMGYLEKPHTSSGRVPSDKGYRVYVDELIVLKPIPIARAEQIRKLMSDAMVEARDLIEQAATVLADQSNYVSVVLTPRYSSSFLQQIKILQIEPGRALVIVVLSEGIIRDRIVRIPNLIKEAQLMELAQSIEHSLQGKKIDDITLVTITNAAEDSTIPEPLLNQVLYEAYVSIKQAGHLDMYLQGQHQLLHQPEFYDIDKAKRFLSTLNKENIVAAYLDDWQSRELPDLKEGTKAISNIRASKDIDNAGKPAFMVRIGQEIALEGMEDCSFITTTYRIGGGLSGQIALIGPRRMPYCRSIAQISFVNQALTDEIRDRFYGNAEDTAADDSSNK